MCLALRHNTVRLELLKVVYLIAKIWVTALEHLYYEFAS